MRRMGLLLAALATPVHAEAPVPDVPVAGRVVLRGSGLPATGELRVGDQIVPLDADGAFRLTRAPGLVTLEVVGPESLPARFEIEVGAEGIIDLKLRVEPAPSGEEVTVLGERREEVSRTVLSAEELRLVPGSFGDPVRALQSLPGVARPGALEGDIVVRGAEALSTAMWIDEIPVPYLFHFIVGRSVINGALLSDVEFLPGALPVRYGNATQAVVNVRTATDRPAPGVHGRLSADLMDTAIAMEGRLPKGWAWRGATRFSWVGGVIGTASRARAYAQGQRDYRPGYVTPRYQDLNLETWWQDERDRVRVGFFGARDVLALKPARFDEDGDGRLDVPEYPDLPYNPEHLVDNGFARAWARWDRVEGERTQRTVLAVGPSRQSNLIPGIGLLGDGPQLGRIQDTTGLLRREDVFPLNDTWKLRTGAEVMVRPARVDDWSQAFGDEGTVTTRDTQVSSGLWTEAAWRREGLLLAPGVRLSTYYLENGAVVVPEPRVGARVPLHPRWTATAYAGRLSQLPTLDRYAAGTGTPGLGVLGAWQGTAGFEARLPNHVEVDFTAWATAFPHLTLKDTEARLTTNPFEPDVAEVLLQPVTREAKGLAAGADLMVRVRGGDAWFGWVALGAQSSQRFDGVRWFPSDRDQPWSVTAVGMRQLPWGFRVSGRFRATAGHPFTPETGIYRPDGDRWSGIPGVRNSARFPAFRQVDLRVDRSWVGDSATWTAYADVYNAFNTKNYLIATYDPTWAELRPTLWIPILPTAGLEVKF